MLTSRSERVIAAKRLHQRKYRELELRFLVEGPQAVSEALNEGLLVEVFALPGEPVLPGVRTHVCDESALRALATSVTPQGVVGIATTVARPLTEAVGGSARLVVVLVEVSDPGNLGAMIRVADAAGADAVVTTLGTVDPHNGKCVRATAGSLFHVPISSPVSVADALDTCRAAGLQIVAAAGGGPLDLDSAEDAGLLAAPTAWLMGNEAHGLPADVLAAADQVIRIPIHGRAESLNVSTAAAVCLYASARAQRRG